VTQPDPEPHHLVKGTSVGGAATRQDQPQPKVLLLNWDSYDVPRLWDMVRREDDEIAWGQAQGFENLAQVLVEQHDNLARLRDSLSGAWDPQTSQAAAKFLEFLDNLIESMASDAIAYASTGRAMHAILTVLSDTKQKVAQLKQEWDEVTTDWVPEWWDHAADRLNRLARAMLAETDAAIGDHRERLSVPADYVYPPIVSDLMVAVEASGRVTPAVVRQSSVSDPGAGPHTGPDTGRGLGDEAGMVRPPPPVPGHDPLLRRGAELAGLSHVPQPVAAVPGSPISLLPVPPGNPYAVGGGAYVLPGRGIGQGRWIYPMPPVSGTAFSPGISRSPSAAETGHPAGSQGGAVPAAGPSAGTSGRGGERAGRRMLVWQVAQGVSPVIGQPPRAAELAEEQLRLAGEAFPDWFAELATPWSDDLKVTPPRRTEPNP
jgi:hypothetical protein